MKTTKVSVSGKSNLTGACMYVCMYVCRDVCYLVRKVLCMYVLMYVCIFSRVRRRGVDPRVATYPESEARSNDYE